MPSTGEHGCVAVFVAVTGEMGGELLEVAAEARESEMLDGFMQKKHYIWP
jgi:hypothetical protein